MIKIGLISDTHAFVDDALLDFLAPVDEIWHAGDIGNMHVLQRLEAEKPVKAVFGNIDDHVLRAACPLVQSFDVEEVSVYMTHIGGYPGNYKPGVYSALKRVQPKIFISGHSHILKVMSDKTLNLLHINPGAAGKSGFHAVRTAVRFVLDAGNIRDMEVWEHPR